MSKIDWNQRYTDGDVPWDTSHPDPSLLEVYAAHGLTGGRALDVGCGSGTNTRWLAEQGFAVLGIDLSPVAIDSARARLTGSEQACRFEVLDFLRAGHELDGGPFDFVFDRGCFHVFDEAEDRAAFAAHVASNLAPGGMWLSLSGSTEGPEREHGPPRRTAIDMCAAIEPVLEIVELRTSWFHADLASPARAWNCLARRREVDAQPSTVRD